MPELVSLPCQFSRIARHVRDGLLVGYADLVAHVQVHHLGSGSHGGILVAPGAIQRCNNGTHVSTRPSR